jgi:hypothetical protein
MREMAFRVGQKVVCVDVASPIIRGDRADMPVEGHIYTISETRADPWTGIPSVRCAELPVVDSCGIPCWYQAKRFRPVVERTTDISIFTAMLNPSKQTVDAR